MDKPVTVGVIANPASGRDVRRLVSGASVFDNAEKGNMVYRLLVGLGAADVARVLMMPAGSGIGSTLERHLRAPRSGPTPPLHVLDMPVHGDDSDSVVAAQRMVAMGVSAIVVLGGDGTNRVVAQTCGAVPLCSLSTGTNNAFPKMGEATTAGLATGLVATGRVSADVLLEEQVLTVDAAGVRAHALVDVGIVNERWVGARALWRPEAIAAFAVAFAEPGAVGLSGVAAALGGVRRGRGAGMWVELAPPETAGRVISAPIAPGLMRTVGIGRVRPLDVDDPVDLDSPPGSIALDGEREIELHTGQHVRITLRDAGPRTIDVPAVLTHAADGGLLDRPVARVAG